MADAQNRYYPLDSSLARRHRGRLNPIIEEDSDDGAGQNRGRARRTDELKIEAWLTPISDHFPTPRGMHYLSAPVLPSSPSTNSATDTSPTASTNPWNRQSVMTEATEFEDLYDVTDEDEESFPPRRDSLKSRQAPTQQSSTKQPTRLIIPQTPGNSVEPWSAVESIKKTLASPVPLTPSAKLPMSPAQVTFMDQQHATITPTISAPPSLDGSLTSEQLAAMSAPPTPVMEGDDTAAEDAWSGVQLQPGALATLHALSSGENPHEQPAQVLEVPQPEPATSEMRQHRPRLMTNLHPLQVDGRSFSPRRNRQSLAELTRLDIPSPSNFFSGLSPRSRNTWHIPSRTPEEMAPPTSTTAEQFYRCPWNTTNTTTSVPSIPVRKDSAEEFYRNVRFTPAAASEAIVEQVIELKEEDDFSDDMPTARPAFAHSTAASTVETPNMPPSPMVEDAPIEIVVDYDPDYARKQQKEALAHLDRTELWLGAQRAYLRGVQDDTPEDEGGLNTIAEEAEEDSPRSPKIQLQLKPHVQPEQPVTSNRKTVRFSNLISTSEHPKRLPSMLVRRESAYYRAFQDYVVRTHRQDVFVHQLARFEAIQAQRVSLRDAHRNQLLGKYQLSVVPQSAKKRLSANVARGDDTIIDDPEKLRREKEAEAMNQMTVAAWHVAAMKMLNGGRLISAPVTKRLARLSRVAPNENGVTRDRARVLDLGGQATCDWAWHCALQFPTTKVYTVTTKAIRQLSNCNVRGPPNHRQVAVERLSRLPFSDNYFDLISARELHSILKFVGENGEDEWEGCLRECMRVLKPGGYLDFSLLDSDIINAGPVGLAKSVEFGFALKTLGYDPNPTKLWLGRLARAGFQDTRRIWMCLPMGARRSMYRPPTPPLKDNVNGEEARTCRLEAMVMGSSDDIASACSLVGGWSWERWLLRCEMEKVSGELRLADTVTTGAAMEEAGKCLDGVAAVFEEGRNCKSGFRMLTGYARKPRAGETIKIGLRG
ncbi:Methyltransf-11 domain-containing protein [Fusarium keratoplasticum]|uniref:Methyltransf-11 domain-containing protein n=1 Tax=Fusarium keratoplasticum TaxID=1328300 RepID=A0ACC0RDC7_9HYPO|nr:Methyltransf-11 domain-containing protein [Fusarium keratoplasticum]KAI8684062.1 Methyltransf-11 domain-containing protein [Fusarium keratoplasticum]KAI8688175.1 Methyltransf-11 domain-containing protein [Fusarium keratoplasticum]